jgi:hypothetical protein
MTTQQPDEAMEDQPSGKPALEISDIRLWCKESRGPDLSDDDALKIAIAFNKAFFEMPFRVPAAKGKKGEKANLDHWRSIAAALKVLQAKVPIVLEEQRRVMPLADHSFLESLLQVPSTYQRIIDYSGRDREHPKGPAKRLTNELSNGIASIFARYGKVYEGARVDAFVQIGLEWLGIEAADSTIGRNRRRSRTK